ncbi:MAG: 3-oxoacyl-ACP reductase FabG [Burkholderiales bacterium]
MGAGRVSANVKKRALVTGGSGVIGAAICRLLAGRGFHVLVHANSSCEEARQLARSITGDGGEAEAVCFDVTDRAACAAALDLLAESQPVQVIVHSAGIHDDAPLAGMSGEQWDRVLSVSLDGFYNVVRPLLLPMIATRWGRIIAMSSVAGILGNRGQVNYAAAKAGLHGAIRALAVEVGSRGVTANVVAPGIIDSDMASNFSEQQIAQLVPMGRAGRAAEVAALVAFLVSDEAGYVSGQIIGVNGAMV